MALPTFAKQEANSHNYRLPPSARVGKVRLAVSNLDRSIAFYRDIIGLAVITQGALIASLGAHGDQQPLLELEEQPNIQPVRERSRLGLYHTAFLLPTRAALSSFVQHLWKHNISFGAGDHHVSEAIYLVDPDGLEVEVYADRPREQWTSGNLPIKMGVQAVNFRELAAVTSAPWQRAPAGTTVGHMHFYVGELRAAKTFYCDGLGLDITVQIPTALFTSAGGYHHHVGLNTWAAGSPIASEKDARLLFWELALHNPEEIDRAAASLQQAGYSETASAHGKRAFADDNGITVTLVAG